VNTVFLPVAMPQIPYWAGRAFRPDPLPDGVLETVRAFSLRPKQFAAFAAEMRHFYSGLAEISRECGKILVPVAILAGAEDRLVSPVDNAQRLHELLPHSTLCIFPATGHEVHHKYRPETLAALDQVAGVDRK
jgi:pimeloyl-ACP methyl ester carboxylesterase